MDKAARAALLTAKGMDNKSENIADYVADLLRQGRASEVTDDLMAQADPQRLHQHYISGNTGMNLPMDYASRMERAARMGFRADLYHGTHKDFPAFDERYVYASNNPNVASTYASPTLGNVMPLAMKGGENSPIVNANGANWNRLSRSMREDENAPTLERKQPTQNDINFGVVKDGEVLGTTQGFSKAAKYQGYSGMTFNDVKDHGIWAAGPKAKRGTPEYEATKLAEKSANQPSTVEVRFDPTNIRSQFARFDPRLDHLAHLSASTGGAMDFARHVEAVHRAGGQIAPSKYLPNVPRAVHAGGGKVAFMQGNHPDVPEVVYHGTYRDFHSFDPTAKSSTDIDRLNPDNTDTGWFGKGHYFTPQPSRASYYAVDTARRWNKKEGAQWNTTEGAQVYPVHLSMKNPFVVHMKEDDSGATTLDKALNNAGVPMHPRGYRMPSEQTAALTAMGYDGVIAKREGKTEEIVAFHPTQIKSAIGNQGTFDPNDPDITKAGGGRIHAEGGGKMDLRSRAANVVSGLQQKRGNVDELLSMLAKGKVKAAELANAGRPFGDSVSKDELAEHFRNAVPQVGVEKLEGKHTYYDDLFLPGGENYREHLLTLQNREKHAPYYYRYHWDERPNILAHVRMADRDNGETLHVGEVQSDWGQQARKRGFYDPSTPFRVYNKETQETKKLAKNQFEARDEAIKSGSKYAIEPSVNYHPPAGPYVGDTQQWTDLALKHILTEAAKGGHKRIVFSPGEHSADMYQQRHPVASFRLHRNPEGSDTLGTLAPYDKDGYLTADGIVQIKDEKDLADQIGSEHAAKLLASPLENLHRSDVLFDPWEKGAPEPTHTLAEPDMHIGGQGMINYYKRNVNSGVMKLLRQHDPSIQPESYDLPPDPKVKTGKGYEGFSVPMTDTARESILKNGWEAYKRGGTVDDEDGITAYHGSPHDFDEFDIAHLGTGEGVQAYGHGLYFAGNEKIAKHYRDTLTGYRKYITTKTGLKTHIPEEATNFISDGSSDPQISYPIQLAVSEMQRGSSFPDAIENMKYNYSHFDQNKLAQAIGFMNQHKPSVNTIGNMYKVKLHVKPEELLDWDKPLSEQPHVLNAIGNRYGDPEIVMQQLGHDVNTATGRDLHDALSGMGQDKQLAAKNLQDMGIKGIRYLDAGSRGMDTDGDPTHNYVMFHHDPVHVVDKYEYGGTVAIPKARDVSAALALTRRFTKDGIGATVALKSKGK